MAENVKNEMEADTYGTFFIEENAQNATTQDDATGRQWTWEEDGMTVIRTNARTAPGCHENCGLLVYLKDGEIDHIEGDPDNPQNQGRLCLRCLAAKEIIYHSDRILHPMKRAKNLRGKDAWEQISWEEAYDLIYEEITAITDKYGAESIWVTQGTGRDINGYGPMLAQMLGTPNYGMGFLSGNACYAPRLFSTSLKVGDMMVCDYSQFFPDRYNDPRWEAPEYIMIWGNNPIVANSDGMLGQWVVDCMKLGSKIICMDPKLTWLAGKAEYWFQLRPGTDCALALAFSNIIIQEDLYDHEFVECWTYGFDEFAENVKEYTPKRVAEICGVPVEDIVSCAFALGNSKSACLQWGVAMDHTSEGFITGMAQFDLLALLGDFEKPGSMVVARPCFGVGSTWMSDVRAIDGLPAPENAAPGSRRMNDKFNGCRAMAAISQDEALEALETGKPYPIKCMWMQTNNPIANMGAEPQRILPALQATEFNVVVDLFMTPTAMACADVFLPACTFVERPGITGHQPYQLGAVAQCIEPLGECKSDQQIIYEIGQRFHGKDKVPFNSQEEFYDYCLESSPFTYEQIKERTWAYPKFEYYRYKTGKLRPDGQPGFNTDTGRYNFWSISMSNMGYKPLASYEEPPESPISSPDLFKDYPFILTTGARRWSLFHSEHRQAPTMRSIHDCPQVMINPDDARTIGVKDGDWVTISNKFGSCREKVEISPRIKRGVVSADHGWWFPERKDHAEDDGTEDGLFGVMQSNINKLLPMRPGKTGLGNSYKSQLCKIEKYEG